MRGEGASAGQGPHQAAVGVAVQPPARSLVGEPVVVLAQAGEVVVRGRAVGVRDLVVEVAAAGADATAGEAAAPIAQLDEAVEGVGGAVGRGARRGSEPASGGGGGAQFAAVGQRQQRAGQPVGDRDAGSLGERGVEQPPGVQQSGQRRPRRGAGDPRGSAAAGGSQLLGCGQLRGPQLREVRRVRRARRGRRRGRPPRPAFASGVGDPGRSRARGGAAGRGCRPVRGPGARARGRRRPPRARRRPVRAR